MQTTPTRVTPTRRTDGKGESTLCIDDEVMGRGNSIVTRVGRQRHRCFRHLPEPSEVEHKHPGIAGTDEERMVCIDLDVLGRATLRRQQTDIHG